MSSPRKKSTPLKHIDAEESALPLSIIPHGVPLTRGFPETSSQPVALVLPTSSPSQSSLTPRPVRPAFSQFLSFGPLTSTATPHTVSESFNEKLKTLKKTEDAVTTAVKVEGFSEEETAELIKEEEDETKDDETKMTADLINANIEEVLNIKMPNYTKLLYGDNDNDGQRFERNSNSSSDEVRYEIY